MAGFPVCARGSHTGHAWEAPFGPRLCLVVLEFLAVFGPEALWGHPALGPTMLLEPCLSHPPSVVTPLLI